MRKGLLASLAVSVLAAGVLAAGWALGTKPARTANLAATPMGFSSQVETKQVTLPYDMTLSPPPSGFAAGITPAQAVGEAAKWDQVSLASSVHPVLAVWTRPAPVPVDPNTDQPLASPSMVSTDVWDVQISGLCEAGTAGPMNRSAPPQECQFNGAHIFIDANTGEYLGELVANIPS